MQGAVPDTGSEAPARTAHEPGRTTDGRGGSLAAIGTVTAIAVAVCALLVTLTRLAPVRTDRRPGPLVEPPPAALADGSPPGPTPERLPAEVAGPVIGVRDGGSLPEDAPACDESDFGQPVKAARLRATPEALVHEVVANPSGIGTQRLACVQWRQGASWATLATASLDDGMGVVPFGQACCTAAGLGVTGTVAQAPEGSRWVLQERAGWWLAYPVGDRPAVTVTWSFTPPGGVGGSPPASRVLYVDAQGAVLDEAFLRG